jgi:hypothetical protein
MTDEKSSPTRSLPPGSVSPRQRRAKRVTLAAVVAVVAGVVAYGIPAHAAYALPDLPAKDVDAWTMPLDRYVPVGETSSAYALLLVAQQCMAGAGYDDYMVPWRDVAAGRGSCRRTGRSACGPSTWRRLRPVATTPPR